MTQTKITTMNQIYTQESLKTINATAQSVEVEVGGLSLDDEDDADDDEGGRRRDSDKKKKGASSSLSKLIRQPSQLEVAARSTLAAVDVEQAVKQAQLALLEANTAKEAFLRSKEEGEFMARQEAKAAQEVYI